MQVNDDEWPFIHMSDLEGKGHCRRQSFPELSESCYMLRLYVCYGCMSSCQSIKLLCQQNFQFRPPG